MSRRSQADEARQRLLAFWEPEDGFGTPIGCLATTFTFQASFFEEECLARFAGLETNAQEDGRAYVLEREEKLAQIFSLVLVDHRQVAPKRSLRWHLLPVRCPGSAIMHAKVNVLVWEHRIRILIGSANLTEPAYRRNFEHMAAFDLSAESDVPLELLAAVLDFLDRVRRFAPGADKATDVGPQAALARFLAQTRARARSWESTAWRRGEVRAVFMPVFPRGPSLFQQAEREMPSQTGADIAWVTSPFFDPDDNVREVVDALVAIMGVRGDREIHFVTSGRELPESDEIDLPITLKKPWHTGLEHRFYRAHSTEENDDVRALHAKSLWLERDGRGLFVIGSSNFTRAGTGLKGGHANIEANVGYVLPDLDERFAKCCLKTRIPADELYAEERRVRFVQTVDRTEPRDPAALLPAAFGLALFAPGGERGALILAITPDAPDAFEILTADDEVFLDAAEWRAAGIPAEVTKPWIELRPPSYLKVRWRSQDGELLQAEWVVNVTNGASLPPPDELRTLGLDDLLAILTSARPLHEVMRQLIRRPKPVAPPDGNGGPNPLEKVDTRNFLLRRMRRVAEGLEGLRERLECPAHHLDSLRWRLEGPIGPLALADKLVEQEPDAASFMLAEVALTVGRADWRRVEASLGRDATRRLVEDVLAELRRRALALKPPPENLARYVRHAFKELER
jgi:hypothetical protein